MTMDHKPNARLGPVVIGLLLATACGGSPTRPSTTTESATTFALTQASVGALIFQAQTTNQTVAAIPPREPGATVVTQPCPGGGSIVMTFDRPAPTLQLTDSRWNTIARVEPRDCRTAETTINGNPYLQMASEITLAAPASNAATSTVYMTMKTTGSLRFDSTVARGKGQVTYDCTQQITSGSSLTIQTSGTISWALENGDVIVGPCGPA